VRVEHLLIVAALGPVVAPQALLGQIEGGALMGLGMALLEELPAPQGHYSATNFDGYLMPSILDAPVIEVIAIEDVPVDDQVGPRGAGEIGLNIAVPAIANAIARALGAPVLQVPVRPAQIMQMLARAAPYPTKRSPGMIALNFTVNDAAVSLWVEPQRRLLDILREDLQLTGAKPGCGIGRCGACMVWLDEVPANSCLLMAFQLQGRQVHTIEAVAAQAVSAPVRTAMAQCGGCSAVTAPAVW